jgi:hypothetical protein
VTLALAGLIIATTSTAALAASGPLTVGSDGFARFDLTPEAGATQVWVEVEDPSVSAANVVVRVDGVDQTVTTTALGAIAVVPATAGTRSFAVALTGPASPDIAVTIIDGVGNILWSTSYQPTLVDYRTLPQSSTPAGIPGWLANTGLSAGIYLALMLLGALSILAGAAMKSRHTRKAAR